MKLRDSDFDPGWRGQWRWSFAVIAFTATVAAGCSQPAGFTTGPFARTDRIDAELKRGVSTKADVERVLGKRNGDGATLMPPTQTKPGDVWVYYKAEQGPARTSGSRPIKVEIDSRDQMVMIFFYGDVFDGYLWFLHTTTATGEER